MTRNEIWEGKKAYKCDSYLIIAIKNGCPLHGDPPSLIALVFRFAWLNLPHVVIQILPYFLMEVAGGRPGLPGLFAAAMFSAALRLKRRRRLLC